MLKITSLKLQRNKHCVAVFDVIIDDVKINGMRLMYFPNGKIEAWSPQMVKGDAVVIQDNSLARTIADMAFEVYEVLVDS